MHKDADRTYMYLFVVRNFTDTDADMCADKDHASMQGCHNSGFEPEISGFFLTFRLSGFLVKSQAFSEIDLHVENVIKNKDSEKEMLFSTIFMAKYK